MFDIFSQHHVQKGTTNMADVFINAMTKLNRHYSRQRHMPVPTPQYCNADLLRNANARPKVSQGPLSS